MFIVYVSDVYRRRRQSDFEAEGPAVVYKRRGSRDDAI